MWKNYIKIAWRNIQRNKLRTGVHLLGLAIGIAVCLLVFHIVIHENSFDRFNPNGDRIYQVNTETTVKCWCTLSYVNEKNQNLTRNIKLMTR